eukprot:scaffold2042_cov123-Cylindrotheca_fusiformis.AAC.8
MSNSCRRFILMKKELVLRCEDIRWSQSVGYRTSHPRGGCPPKNVFFNFVRYECAVELFDWKLNNVRSRCGRRHFKIQTTSSMIQNILLTYGALRPTLRGTFRLCIILGWMTVLCAVTAFRTSTPSPRLNQHTCCCFQFISAASRFSMATSVTGGNDDCTHDDAKISSTTESPDQPSPPPPKKKLHSVTVCMVPPPEYKYVWETISNFRLKLKDPGFYRWPPHANLLYPFLELGSSSSKDEATRKANIDEVVKKLQAATCQCSPFKVSLNRFGTFGGKQRGVLWLDPESSYLDTVENDSAPPLVNLQQKLEEAFPTCNDQSKKGNAFTPHMTISHFENLDAALDGQNELEIPKDPPLEFVLDRIYLLERFGDGGQFLRVAQIGLGSSTTHQLDEIIIFDPPSPFPDMPMSEADWVYEERRKQKSRRNGRRGGGNNRSRRRRSTTTARAPSRIPDPPEVIAAKRAERKAKRERLEREQRRQAETSTDDKGS